MKKIFLMTLLFFIQGFLLLPSNAKNAELDALIKKIEERRSTPMTTQDNVKAEEEKQKIKFSTKKSNLWIKNSSLAKNKKDNDDIEVVLLGKVYDEPQKITLIEKKDVNRSTPETTITSIISATKSGDVEWITENFTPEDQVQIKELNKNKEFVESNKTFIDEQSGQFISAVANYKDYLIVFVKQIHKQGMYVVDPVVLKKTESGWKQTISLVNDETFDVISAALTSGNVSKGIKVDFIPDGTFESNKPQENKNNELEKVKEKLNDTIKKESEINTYLPKLF